MEEVQQLLFNIEQKLHRLEKVREADKKEVEILKVKTEELQQLCEDQQKRIIELQEKIKFLKITKSLEKGKENIDAKLKINEMLREIDKCIGMLNS